MAGLMTGDSGEVGRGFDGFLAYFGYRELGRHLFLLS